MGENSEGRSGSAGDGHERRRLARTPVLLRVEYAQRADFIADYVTDFSAGGLFIRTDLALEVGQRLSLVLSFPGLLEATALDALVRWKRERTNDCSPDQVGVGVEFVDLTDVVRTQLARLAGVLERASLAPARTSQRALRVMLVEDNDFVSELFSFAIQRFQQEQFRGEAQELRVATTAHEAARTLQTYYPDVIILDHYLPGLTGCALLRHLRKQDPFKETPILVISTGGPEVHREAMESGATLFLDKPVLLAQIVHTLRALVCSEAACT